MLRAVRVRLGDGRRRSPWAHDDGPHVSQIANASGRFRSHGVQTTSGIEESQGGPGLGASTIAAGQGDGEGQMGILPQEQQRTYLVGRL
jgi:hypothetical protein